MTIFREFDLSLGEAIDIGKDIKIILLNVEEHSVRLGCKAPRSVSVYREEVDQSNIPKYVEKVKTRVISLKTQNNQTKKTLTLPKKPLLTLRKKS